MQKRNKLDVEVVVIILAHDGLKNQIVWEKWFSLPNAEKISAVMYVDSNINKTTTAFEQKFKATSKTCSMISTWGGVSLVNITVQLMKEAISKYPNAQVFRIISGKDVPICTPTELLKMERKTSLDSGPQNGFYIKHGNKFYFVASKFIFKKSLQY
jgi:hypothetical protein